ncbi:MAG: NUDIX domain-containing protein [Candidatus Methylacidiphilales bacterium]
MIDEKLNPWKTKSIKTAYENNWIEVEHHEVINPSGGDGIYGKVHYKNLAIGIIPLDENNNTWLIGQYRYPLNKYSWEIPEGGGKLGVPPIDSAKRELLEECGLEAKEWTEILQMHLSNSVSDELAIIFTAKGLTQKEAEPEDTEQLQIKKLPFTEVYKMVMNGEITDSMSVAAVLKLAIMLKITL